MSTFSEELSQHINRQLERERLHRITDGRTLAQSIRDFFTLPDVNLVDEDIVIDESDSTAIAQAKYNNDTTELHITFTSGSQYAYKNVPLSIYEMYMVAGSKGRFFNFLIKPFFDYERLT